MLLIQVEFPNDSQSITEFIESVKDGAIAWDDSKLSAYVEQHELMSFDAVIHMDRRAIFRTDDFLRQDDLLEVLDEVPNLSVIPISNDREIFQ